MGWTLQIKTRQALLSVLVTIPMVFGQFFIGPVLTSNAALGITSFEIGDDESLNAGTESQDIVDTSAGGIDWLDLPSAGASFDELEVKVINDQNFVGATIVMNPDIASGAENCTQENDLIVKGGTKIDDFPFPTVESSPSPGKNDICQVYVSYEFDGSDTIAYIGVVRRETGGTTAIAVELNKISHSNRQVDDLLVMFEFDGSGPVSSLAVRSWNGSTWGDPVPLAANEWDGTSWEHFGEVAVNLSATGLLPPPVSVDDCDSFSSISPYGVAGNSNNSNVGDWGGEHPIDIPRCGQISITKIATPAADASFEFDWELSDNAGVLASATGTLIHGETDTFDIVDNEVLTLTETSADSPYVLDRIECSDDLGAPVAPDSISVGVGESVSCTIYNEASAVQVVKAGQGDPTADFNFTITGNDAFDLSLGESSSTYLYLPGTTVTIDENLPASAPAWSLTGIACLGSESGDVSPIVDLDAGTATFDTLAGELITCTYSNAQDALLTLEKTVINDSGGGAADTEWTLHANGPTPISGAEGDLSVTNANVAVGSYDLSETNGPDGYTMVGWDCGAQSMDDADTVTLAAGDIVTCTITNDDDPGTLTLLKTVSPQHGGSAADTAWTLTAVGATPGISGNEGDPEVTNVQVVADDYALSESGGPFGWVQQGEWDCGDAPYDDSTDTVTVGLGKNVTCTVTNTDIAPTLTLVKDLTANYGGDASELDFLLTASGPMTLDGVNGKDEPGLDDGGDSDVINEEVLVGTYTLSETSPPGYVQVGEWSCVGGDFTGPNQIELGPGGSATCTVTNIDVQPTITVVKDVSNDHGGQLGVLDFPLYIDSNLVTHNVAQGVLSNTEYVISEDLTGIVGYQQVGAVSCSVDGGTDFDLVGGAITLEEGEDAVCTIFNEDIPSTLTLLKDVITNDGGEALDTAWTLSADGNSNITGNEGDASITDAEVLPGDYDLSESGPAGYLQVGGWDCGDAAMVDDDTVTIPLGADVTCEVTNDDVAPGLTVVKFVVNDDGGTAAASEFQLYVNGSPVDQGVPLDVDANVEYTVTEDNLVGYTDLGVACEDEFGSVPHPVTLSEGQAVLCTYTNDDIPPQLTLEKVVLTNDGGEAADTDWTLTATGSEDIISGSEGDASITNAEVKADDYDLTESEIAGYVQLGNWDCGEAEMVDGDTVTLSVGDVVTCTVTNDDVAGSITVIKEVVPVEAALPDDFALTITPDGGEPIPTLSGDQQLLGTGTYTVGETLLEGFQQISLSCTEGEGEGQVEVAHPVVLGLDQHVTCTIVNGESPTVTVVKATQPESSDLFRFTLSPGDTQDVAGNGGSYTWEDLSPGEFQLTEATPVDWSLETVQCDTEYDEIASGASFGLDWGDHVTCVFTNGELGSITVEKVTDIETDELFDIAIDGGPLDETVKLGNGDSETWDLLAPGEYTIEEILVGFNWDISLACEGGTVVIGDEVTGESGKTLSGTITLGFGDDVTCTYTNERADADLAVTKDDLVDPITLNDDNPVGEIEYVVTVTNNGPAVAEDVVVTDTLPASLTFISATPSVGSCAHAAGIVTCDLGDMAVGDVVTIAIVTETETLGEVTDLTPENVVEVSSTTPDPDPSNNVDDEVTDIIEVEDIIILPFTGVYGDFWFMMALLLISSGALVLFMSRILKDSDQANYPG